ncbi:unnamed protein product [Leuciscus chuanchicus]
MADQTIITPEWLPDCFTVLNISKTHVSGFITNKADLNTVLECHKRETLTSFIAWSDDKRKKEKGPHRLVWQVEDFSEDVPLAVTNRVIHCCQHGNPRKNCQTQEFVNTELSVSDCVLPKSHDQCYFPTSHTIQNHVHLALVAGRYSGLDQLNLEIKLNKWKEDDPAAHFYFRKCSEAQIIDDKSQDGDGVNSEEQESTMQNTFLFVHQSQEQQRLLKRYGDMVLLDATYRTTKYALPLFLVVVRTNVGYKPVAEFICENESTMAISEALSLIKKWNDAWNPNYFMTDYCEQEYQALQLVFPNTPKYLCSFHREQAWIHWTRESKNHLSDQDGSELLGLLRSVASAHDRETCEAAISKLRDSVLYKSNTEVRNYVEKRWLNIKERWCRGFSPHGFNVSVTTNNGTEAMNNSLKSFYLKISGTKTVSSLVEIIVTEFIPEQLLSYAKLNYMYSSEHKVYSANVPEFLWDRPRTFVQHCLKNLEAACCYTSQQVQEQSKGLYKVQSEQSCEWYSVDLGDKDRFPSWDQSGFLKENLLTDFAAIDLPGDKCILGHVDARKQHRNQHWLPLFQYFYIHACALGT